VGMLLPAAMLLPWGYWNYLVYGWDFILAQSVLHEMADPLSNMRLLLFLILALIGLLFWQGRNLAGFLQDKFNNTALFAVLMLILGLVFVWIIRGPLTLSLLYSHLPKVSWVHGLFSKENVSFYFGKLVEFSFLYALGFLSFFMLSRKKDDGDAILKIVSFLILAFYTLWGNYQSRYILTATPFLMILGVETWLTGFEFFVLHSRRFIRVAGIAALVVLIVFIVLRTFSINVQVSFTNRMCYF
jgi:hypothetical protein